MSRDFKVGDRVRFKENYGKDVKKGDTGVVSSFWKGEWGEKFPNVSLDRGGFETGCYPYRLELTRINPPYAPGDKVRVTFEGTVQKDKHDGCIGVVLDGDPGTCFYEGYGLDNAKSIEVIERAKPAWADRHGTIIRGNRTGRVWHNKSGKWYTTPDYHSQGINSDDFGVPLANFTLLYGPAA